LELIHSDNNGLSDGEEIIIDKEKFEEGINNGNAVPALQYIHYYEPVCEKYGSFLG
jgi:hypothetical protein